MPRISAHTLSARLHDLKQLKLVQHVLLDTSPPTAEHLLTELGRELLPAIDTLVCVGQKLIDNA